MAKKIKLILAAFVAAVSFGIYQTLAINNASAEEADRHPILLQISPTKQKISITPGSSYVGSFIVHNAGTQRFSYSVSATPYSVTNQEYNPDYSTVARYSQMSDWVTFDESTRTGTLEPGTMRDVAFTVNVPADVPAGTQYAALMAQTEDGNADNATIAVIHRVGMILAATVPGDTRETGEIIKNNVSTFYFNPPVTMSSLVKNTGNVEQTAKYTYKIYPLFSNEALYNNEEDPQKLDIYPETERFNSMTWEGAPTLGIFWMEQTVELGDQVPISKVGKLVLICPLWLIFIIFALLFAAIFWLVARARSRKNVRAEANSSDKKEEA
ncbi:hypothetical protein IKG12_02335 [Candidatus Saccharibacteria bacterium]|nr:hypothetical protein [Candidatus Saccharibacteria bacterium]